ncbi:hypothetical protein L3Q82_024118, partial [Scortum barcoo]
ESLKKAEKVGPMFTEKLPVSAEMSIWNGKPERCLTVKWRKTISDRLKHGEGRTKTNEAMLKQHANRETNKDENGSQEENSALGFSVLPNTFNFKDGSKVRKETSDLVPDKPNFVKGKDKGPSKTAMRARAVPEPGGSGSNAAEPSARRQQAEQFVGGVTGDP